MYYDVHGASAAAVEAALLCTSLTGSNDVNQTNFMAFSFIRLATWSSSF